MTLQQKIVRSIRAVVAGLALGVIGTGYAVAQAVPTVTITAVAASPFGPTSVVVTWTSTNATACVANGSWTGAKALAGTQTFTGVKTTPTYTLICSSAAGTALVTWTPPTTWEDLDPLPAGEPGSYHVKAAATAAGVPIATAIVVPAPASAYTLTGLPAGAVHVGVIALSTEGVQSDLSNISTKTIVLPSASATAMAIVRRKPRPPVGVLVADAP